MTSEFGRQVKQRKEKRWVEYEGQVFCSAEMLKVSETRE